MAKKSKQEIVNDWLEAHGLAKDDISFLAIFLEKNKLITRQNTKQCGSN